jgi:hypothetical protein
MKRFARYILFFLISRLISGCQKDKYAGLSGDIILKGTAFIVDSSSTAPPVPLADHQVYLGMGSDTATYVFQSNTDSAGQFTVSPLNNKYTYTIYTHFVVNGIKYAGAKTFTAAKSPSKTMTITLNVLPLYQNGMSILISDAYGGPIPNLPFRIYKSRLIALVDSTQYASVNTTTDANGHFVQYNIPTGWYYIVSNETIANTVLKVFDSVNVLASGVSQKNAVLH